MKERILHYKNLWYIQVPPLHINTEEEVKVVHRVEMNELQEVLKTSKSRKDISPDNLNSELFKCKLLQEKLLQFFISAGKM